MLIAFSALTSAVIVLAIGILEGIITGYSKEIYRFSLPFAYSMVVIADIFLYKYVNYLTDRGRKAYFPVLLIGVVLIIVLFLPWNFWGTPIAEIARPYIRLYSTLGLIVYSYLIYISIIFICQRSKNYSVSRINRRNLSLFSWAIVALLFFFLMFIFDTLLLVFTDSPGYSIFVYFAWIFAVIFLLLSYLSLVLHEEEVQEVLEMIAKLKKKKLTEEELIYHK